VTADVEKEKIVLLVEDNPFDVLLTRRALAKLDIAHQLIIAEEGAEALEYLFKHNTDEQPIKNLPDLVLLDLKMLGIDGFEVLKRIRSNEKTRLLPVVIITSSNEETDVNEANRFGATDYYVKPVDANEYGKMIVAVVSKYFT